MPQTLPPVASDAALTADEEFLALLCADEELLRAEFDAIIAAEWPTTPPRRPCGEHAAGPSSHSSARRFRAGQLRLPNWPRRPGIGGWARQRSPPFGGQWTTQEQEGSDARG